MVRVFQVYYPARTLVLLGGEALLACSSFLAAAMIQFGGRSGDVLAREHGYGKIIAISLVSLLCSHAFDLYDPERLTRKGEARIRLLVSLGVLSFLLAGLAWIFPSFVLGRNVFLVGLIILTFALWMWRGAYTWSIRQQFLRDRVYVLGSSETARRLVEILRQRKDLGMEVVGWAGVTGNGPQARDALASSVRFIRRKGNVDRVVVAQGGERRGMLPVSELLDVRLSGIKVEDATSLLEQVTGRIDVDELHPSWLIFGDGFRLRPAFMLFRRIFTIVVSLLFLLLCLPLIPLIVIAIKLTSPGPALYRQDRVGKNGVVFKCYKFRTMRPDAEADTGPVWASDEDPRITKLGHFLRKSRLDEIPQLWNVLRGDMGFIGPRPERPEFVAKLAQAIPYYNLRHIVRPGVTGWAQVRYQYGASIAEAKEKLQYDLYYIKHMSLSLDMVILFHTVKTVLGARGAR